jgi:two-component system, NarL family, nitrate/nitrite response regulator NarL
MPLDGTAVFRQSLLVPADTPIGLWPSCVGLRKLHLVSVVSLESPDPDPSCRIALVGSVPAFRRGLAAAFSDRGAPVSEVVAGEPVPAGCGVVLVTVRGPDELDLLAPAARQAVVVAVLSDGSPASHGEALRLGASAAVAENESVEEIVEVVLAASEGRARLPSEIARTLATSSAAPAPVSTQERGWLRSLAHGATVAELAEESCYSERELYRRLGRLYRRLGAETRAEALVRAAKAGILQ